MTPQSVANRPGLAALAYRVGTHSTFLETMLARLSTIELEHEGAKFRPLARLTTREQGDPSIALLDAWALVADVLTFYQERIANEGYLRTATERRSVIELARLVGYRLRPGLAASVWLALTLEADAKATIEPFQVRAQSVPGPGELPASFENIEKIETRGLWNKLTPRHTQPQNVISLTKKANEPGGASLYLKGITTGLNPGDPLLVTVNQSPLLFRVIEANAEAAADRSRVVLQPWIPVTTSQVINAASLSAVVNAFEDPGAARTHLNALSAELEAGRSEAELAAFIERETLPALERVAARKNISKALKERVRALSEELEGAVVSLRESESTEDDSTAPGPMAARLALAAMSTTEAAQNKIREDKVLRSVVDGLSKPASIPPRNSFRLGRDATAAFSAHSDLGIQAIGVFQPTFLATFPIALGNTPIARPALTEVYAFRVKSSPFGHNAPLRSRVNEFDKTDTEPKHTTVEFSEWTAADVHSSEDFFKPSGAPPNDRTELCKVLYLDGSFDKIQAQSWVVVDTGAIALERVRQLKVVHPPVLIARSAKAGATVSRGVYGLSGNATQVELADALSGGDAAWLAFTGKDTSTDEFQVIRRTVIFAQAEKLELTEAPIDEDICTTEANQGWIVLDGVYSELKSGRWVIVEGERSDVLDGFGNRVSGVKGTELAMLAEVVHDIDTRIPGDTSHTRIKFAADLEYCYVRDEITIYGNVVKATHGETRKETLGSGDGSKALQQFSLKQPPLTYVSAPTPSGTESTLKVFVNDVEWHETQSIFGLQSTDRRFVTKRDDAEVTTAIFGNGKQGARLPTGSENVRAEYRQGIGKAGNVAERKITLLASRPLGVKEVINPQRANGGANPEGRDQARKNAPLAVLALDRLVSTRDYADFAHTFGGVGKAFSARLSDGVRELVHVTIAGVDDSPIDEGSDLLRNLRVGLVDFGDPAFPVQVAVRELLLLVISAGVRLLPDYVWEKVAPKIRSAMLDTFGFEARELGQDVFLSEVVAAMQSVTGVAYVDIDALGGIAERNADGSVRTPTELIEAAQAIVTKGKPDQRVPANLPELPSVGSGTIRPAQLAYLVPEVPDTLILNLIE
ncbi:MAG TPA: putative baseplate assembly protein [Pyrinomonadaceae bacterium]|nr:putative baseplate assembly protein [Pyrinomonadaceae bacterium]